MKISYLIPKPSSEGGMTAISKMLYEIDYFDNVDTFHFNTSFDSSTKPGRFIEFFSKQFAFSIHLIKVKPDVLFIMSSSYLGFYDKLFYSLIGRIFGVKTMLNHVGGEFDKFYNQSKLNRVLIKIFITFPHVLLIGSTFWCDYFANLFPNKKIINSPNPIISNQFEVGVNSRVTEKFKIVSLFRMVKEKGLFELVEVIKQVSKRNLGVEFVIMGGGPMLDDLKHLLNDYVLRKDVTILGFVDDDIKIQEICTSNLYLMLTHFDLMPISIMEAMAAGKPVISTEVGGIPDLVKHDYNGYLFEVGEVDAVVQKIIELTKSRITCLRLGENSLNVIKEKYDIKSVTKLHRYIATDLIKSY